MLSKFPMSKMAIWMKFNFILSCSALLTDIAVFAARSTPLQVEEMLILKDKLDPSNLTLTTWNKYNDCVNWRGVRCNDFDNFAVISITVTFAGLNGTLSEEIGNISSLTILNLTGNWIYGSIPESIGFAQSLQSIDLSQNMLSGIIPKSIGFLNLLHVLDLHSNNLIGQIPSNFLLLRGLQNLNLAHNRIDGSVPDELWSLPLTSLNMEYNNLNGTIFSSNWTGKTGIKELSLAGNMVISDVQNIFERNPSLQLLDLSFCGIYGSFPERMPSKISHLYMNSNQLHGSLSGLDSLNLPRSLTQLDLSKNSLSGPVPSALATLPHLNILDLSYNSFSGALPKEFSSSKSLVSIDLSSNNLSGSMPNNFLSMNSCEVIALNDNNISGLLPTAVPMNLKFLSLSDNYLMGNISSAYFKSTLSLIDLSNNRLSGVSLQNKSMNVSSLIWLSGNILCQNASKSWLSSLCKPAKHITQLLSPYFPLNPANTTCLQNCSFFSPIQFSFSIIGFKQSLLNLGINEIQSEMRERLSSIVVGINLNQLWLINVTRNERSLTIFNFLYFNYKFNSDVQNRILFSRIIALLLKNETTFGIEFGRVKFLQRHFDDQGSISDFGNNPQGGRGLSAGAIAIIVTASAMLAILILVFTIQLVKKKQKKCESLLEAKNYSSSGFSKWLDISNADFGDVKEMTSGFCESNLISSYDGKYLYKGRARNNDKVCVLLFEADSKQKAAVISGLQIMSSIAHPNVARVRALSEKSRKKAIVLEDCEQGNLFSLLNPYSNSENSRPLMTMDIRLKIAIGVASALEHLHFSSDQRILHNDVSTKNVFVDASWKAKLGGFEKCRVLEFGGSRSREGTEDDMTSFGVLLLELFCKGGFNENETPLNWALSNLGAVDLESIIDPFLGSEALTMETIIDVVKLCVDGNSQTDVRDTLNTLEMIEEMYRREID